MGPPQFQLSQLLPRNQTNITEYAITFNQLLNHALLETPVELAETDQRFVGSILNLFKRLTSKSKNKLSIIHVSEIRKLLEEFHFYQKFEAILLNLFIFFHLVFPFFFLSLFKWHEFLDDRFFVDENILFT